MTEERLQKLIAQAGIASRRKAEEFITAGRVRVNGQVVTELGRKADPKKDKIEVDGGIGPATIKAIQNVELERVRAYRVLRFANLVIKKPEQERFWYGWYKRATEV